MTKAIQSSWHSKEFVQYLGTVNLQNPGDPSEVEVYYIQRALFEKACELRVKRDPRLIDWIPAEAYQSINAHSPTVEPINNLTHYAVLP